MGDLYKALNQSTYLVFANRTGIAGDAVYVITSPVLKIHRGNIYLYKSSGRSEAGCSEAGLLVVDVQAKPSWNFCYIENEIFCINHLYPYDYFLSTYQLSLTRQLSPTQKLTTGT